jgi:hypothetical protein
VIECLPRMWKDFRKAKFLGALNYTIRARKDSKASHVLRGTSKNFKSIVT